ncbi:redoxin domain-containing protein [Petrimonas sp.]|uniref:redoxin domain-containing protein n=1 Tax=Petrimonas sp. TaxID=2023866 RepID=UPI003F51177C
MKNLFILATALLIGLAGCAKKQTTYNLSGVLEGNTEGKKVYLYDIYEQTPFDSTVIANGKFAFTGTMDTPKRVRLIIDNNAPENAGNPRGWKTSIFYLENSDIHFTANVDNMDNYWWTPDAQVVPPVITGSESQALYETYNKLIKEKSSAIAELDEKYIAEYHIPAMNDTMNTEVGISLIHKIQAEQKELNALKLNFIKQNPASPVAFDLVKGYFEDMFVYATADEIDEVMGAIRPSWQNTPAFTALEETAASAKKIAIGSPYVDVQVLNEKDEPVKLSDFIKPGNYTVLEFWASWCGPCRAEIPHLKHAHNEFKNKGFDIISISFDERKEDWEKAKAEEKMPWTQLYDPSHFDSEAAKIYRISGIPYSLLLDKEGNIIAADMRGARLDAILYEAL